MSEFTEFYSSEMPPTDEDHIPEIRIKLWLNSNLDNDQISELMKRLYQTLEGEGFFTPGFDEDDMDAIMSLHSVRNHDTAKELVDSLKDDPTLVMVLLK